MIFSKMPFLVLMTKFRQLWILKAISNAKFITPFTSRNSTLWFLWKKLSWMSLKNNKFISIVWTRKSLIRKSWSMNWEKRRSWSLWNLSLPSIENLKIASTILSLMMGLKLLIMEIMEIVKPLELLMSPLRSITLYHFSSIMDKVIIDLDWQPQRI